MTMKLAPLADRLALKLVDAVHPGEWDELRDRLDALTGGELDYEPLNILTDMVTRRLETRAHTVKTHEQRFQEALAEGKARGITVKS
jgi:hypothetical protein